MVFGTRARQTHGRTVGGGGITVIDGGDGEDLVIVEISSNYTAVHRDFAKADASGGAITVTVPVTKDALVAVKKTDSSNNAVTVEPASGNIDGEDSVVLPHQNAMVFVQGDGTNCCIRDLD